MRCRACDAALTDKESTRRYAFIEEYLELCDNCYEHIKDEVETINNPLVSDELYDEFIEDEEGQ